MFSEKIISIKICIDPTPTPRAGGRVQLIWIQSFPSPGMAAFTKAKEPNLSNYLPVAGGRGERTDSYLS